MAKVKIKKTKVRIQGSERVTYDQEVYLTDKELTELKAAKPGKELDDLIAMYIDTRDCDGDGPEDCEYEIDPKPRK